MTREELTLLDQATFHQAATPSRPHSQHCWWCQKYDAAIPSLCLSVRRQQLEDLLAESGLAMTRMESPPRSRARSATLRLWMADARPTLAQGDSSSQSPSFSTVLGPAAALVHALPGTHRSGPAIVDPRKPSKGPRCSPTLAPCLPTAFYLGSVAKH